MKIIHGWRSRGTGTVIFSKPSPLIRLVRPKERVGHSAEVIGIHVSNVTLKEGTLRSVFPSFVSFKHGKGDVDELALLLIQIECSTTHQLASTRIVVWWLGNVQQKDVGGI